MSFLIFKILIRVISDKSQYLFFILINTRSYKHGVFISGFISVPGFTIRTQNELKYYFRSNRFTSVFCYDSNRMSNVRYFNKSTFLKGLREICTIQITRVRTGWQNDLFGSFIWDVGDILCSPNFEKKPCTPVSRSRYNIRFSDIVCSQTTTSGARSFGAVLRDFHDIYTLRVGQFPVGNGYRLTRFHFFVSYFKQNERGREKALPMCFINSRLVRAQNNCRSFARTKFRYPKKCNP